MLKLLGRSSSINVRKVLWTLDELALAYVHEPSAGDDLRTPEFLAMNPNAMIPVLLDDGFVLWESNAICRYLAGREARDDLLPTAPAERAIVEQWMDWQAGELNQAWRYAFLSLVRHHPDYRDPQAVATSIASWNRHMRMLDDRLATTGAYVAGPDFTLADIVIGLATWRWTMTPIERPVLPAVEAWVARLAKRPPYLAQAANGKP